MERVMKNGQSFSLKNKKIYFTRMFSNAVIFFENITCSLSVVVYVQSMGVLSIELHALTVYSVWGGKGQIDIPDVGPVTFDNVQLI